MSEVILAGGPRDGHHVTAAPDTRSIEVVTSGLPPRRPAVPPRPSLLRHPFRWLRYRPLLLPDPLPDPVQVTYKPDGTYQDGLRVFRITGGWQPFRGPDIMPEDTLYKALVTALYAVHPAIRQDRHSRWVMDLGWYKRVRASAGEREDPDHDDPDKWTPSPQDLLLGIPVHVTADGALPHLENPRYPADAWADGLVT